MPEIAPSPDFRTNFDRPPYDRSMVLQAWGTYGTLWPVVHHQLGVSPDLGRDELAVVPQIPDGQSRVAGINIRLGSGSVDVTAERGASTLTTTVNRRLTADLLTGHGLPDGAQATSATLNGASAEFRVFSWHAARRSPWIQPALRRLAAVLGKMAGVLGSTANAPPPMKRGADSPSCGPVQ